MQTYKTINGVEKLNEYIKAGWKFVHAYSKQVGFDKFQDFEPMFVIVWDFPGKPKIPKRYQKAKPIEPVPVGRIETP